MWNEIAYGIAGTMLIVLMIWFGIGSFVVNEEERKEKQHDASE